MVTKVEKLEPLSLRKEWMNNLAQAVAFLESLNLAHGDLRPENILLDRNRLKLSDFDCTAEIGTYFEACIPPYGRILNENDADEGERESSGLLGPRTEQFALGSLYYLINYGFEIYGDRCLDEDPNEHGPKVLDLLQKIEFPVLDGDPLIDDIIDRCWHSKYATVAELAAHTKSLLNEVTEGTLTTDEVAQTKVADGRQPNGDHLDDSNKEHLADDFCPKKAFCQDLMKRGLLDLLSSGEPDKLGFSFEWYRYSFGR